ncbi:amino acid ABC transporter substrate-binding protein [Chelatococcus sambhunathii]|uniref:Amino acid ABC transporter substrate-binding protein n=1 Tax=Chelatococcus sambhunathii TaxID=363953 RepID=A0ABU1DB26_9HYPH|nr:amino acid ABC transporter substrate-binding protein [Chelatococcus sambhunathii]MDR4305271.1 amino acid ABC transporter substrate-binding protein [Chelatococcus sambhunathii]
MARLSSPLLAAGLALAVMAGAARAQEPATQPGDANVIAGTLKKVHDAGVIALGYREASFPFSYLVGQRPVGYSIDLCLHVVEEIRKELDDPAVNVAFVKVTPETRIPDLVAGKVDIECGSTTANKEREKQVAFSPIMFVAGTKLMVKAGSSYRSYRDLAGKTVVATAGTTNEAALRALNDRNKLGLNIVTAPDHEQSYQMTASGQAEAFATDDALLYGLIARHHGEKDFIVVGGYLSYDPYGLMFRKDDPQMARAVGRAFSAMAKNRDLFEAYHRWFERRTPSGEEINLPMSPQLTEVFRAMGMED